MLPAPSTTWTYSRLVRGSFTDRILSARQADSVKERPDDPATMFDRFRIHRLLLRSGHTGSRPTRAGGPDSEWGRESLPELPRQPGGRWTAQCLRTAGGSWVPGCPGAGGAGCL